MLVSMTVSIKLKCVEIMNTFIRQSGRHRQKIIDIYRETHHTISCITQHIVVELGQQVRPLLIALCSVIKTVLIQSSQLKIINDQNISCSKPDLRYKRL